MYTINNSESLSCGYSGRLILCNTSKAFQIANSLGVPYDELVIIHNDPTYGGAGYYGGPAVTYNGSWGTQVFVHEFAHSFGFLLDEYVAYSGNGTITNSVSKNCYRGTPTTIVWPGTYSSDYRLECYYSNWYRPAHTSLMRDIDSRTFNLPSQHILVEEIENVIGNPTTTSTSMISPTPFHTPTPTIQNVPEDINEDQKVNIIDYNMLLSQLGNKWNQITIDRADINNNNTVEIFDYTHVVRKFN